MNDLQKQQTALIIRIAGVTDAILKGQLQEEYLIIEAKIDALKKLDREHKQKLFNNKIINIVNEHKQFYQTQFVVENDIILALQLTNGMRGLTQLLKSNRLRIPKSLRNRRQLLNIAHTLQWNLSICDMEGFPIDTITTSNPKIKLKLYTSSFSRWDDCNGKNYEIVVPKHCLDAPFL